MTRDESNKKKIEWRKAINGRTVLFTIGLANDKEISSGKTKAVARKAKKQKNRKTPRDPYKEAPRDIQNLSG